MASVVKSAERALQVLLLLSRSSTALSTRQIAQACKIPKSSAHHLLNVMLREGFLSYDAASRWWRPGPVNLEVGRAYLRDDPLQAGAREIMRELSDRVGATAHLAVLDGQDVLYIRKVEPSKNTLRLVTEAGMRLPAQLTSVGLAILARMPDEEIARRFPSRSLARRTQTGPQNFKELMAAVKKVRRNGCARENGMVTPGIACIADAVVDRLGAPVAAVGITYVSAQMKASQVKAAAAAVHMAAGKLSHTLGGGVIGDDD